MLVSVSQRPVSKFKAGSVERAAIVSHLSGSVKRAIASHLSGSVNRAIVSHLSREGSGPCNRSKQSPSMFRHGYGDGAN